MNLPINPEPPEVMHIDLNSAFAMTEQQANPLLRGKPVGVTNRLNDYAICIAASYEAKGLGINLGTRNGDARKKSPDFQMLETDPAKYKYVHGKIRDMFAEYAPSSYMKSIDEGIIDFRGMRKLLGGRSLEDIGYEIKQRVRGEIGDYMTVNVGIGLNLWMAKLAAGFDKPDGLTVIDARNLEVKLGQLKGLTDLPYIAERMRTRLVLAGIYTPVDMLNATESKLKKEVFKSVIGSDWYYKLRGYETEKHIDHIRTVGRSYVLEHRTSNPLEIETLLYKAGLKVARRMLKFKLEARGLALRLKYLDETDSDGYVLPGPRGFADRHLYGTWVRRGSDIYARAADLYRRSVAAHGPRVLTHLVMHAYDLREHEADQLDMFDQPSADRYDRIEAAMNEVNDRYGELVLQPAAVLASRNPMKDKIPFGTIRYFEDSPGTEDS